MIMNDISLNMNTKFSNILDLFEFCDHLMKFYGLNALSLVNQILFYDIDSFNATSLLVQLVKLVVMKRDQTTIDLGPGSSMKANAIADQFLK
jgi:hypothetical protein